MSFSLLMLWHDRRRFFAGILAVGFGAVLTALQYGLMLGMFALNSAPIDHSSADIWITSPDSLSVDVSEPIPERYLLRLAAQPEVILAEPLVLGYSYWEKPQGGNELCIVVGARLPEGSLGAVRHLTPELRGQLAEPGTVVVDESDLSRLGISGVGERVQVSGQRVRIIGTVRGLQGLTAPYLFCSQRTARRLLDFHPNQTTYVLGKCRRPEDVAAVVERLRDYDDMAVHTSEEFSSRSRLHWLLKTKAGLAMSITAILGLLVGAVVTNQTLSAATLAQIREYSVLRALGLPRWRLRATVLAQAFWLGLTGAAVAMPVIFVLSRVMLLVQVPVALPWWLLTATTLITVIIAVLSGLAAMRVLRKVEPAMLLR